MFRNIEWDLGERRSRSRSVWSIDVNWQELYKL